MIILWPFTIIYYIFILLRKLCYKLNFLKSYRSPIPVIVVGNITIGGTGKTPVVIYIAHFLHSLGLKPGIITRGYKGNNTTSIMIATIDSDPNIVGDESILLAKRTNCPVIIGKNRALAAQYLIKNFNIDLIISDDGLQHYALQRDLEIVVIDGTRYFGNKFLLPAGPLRAPITTLNTADCILINTPEKKIDFSSNFFNSKNIFNIAIKYNNLLNVYFNKTATFQELQKTAVNAVAGIGNNWKFFDALKNRNLAIIPHEFPDHHKFKIEDLKFNNNFPIIMTEKDAIKCTPINLKILSKEIKLIFSNMWYLPIDITISQEFDEFLLKWLQKINKEK